MKRMLVLETELGDHDLGDHELGDHELNIRTVARACGVEVNFQKDAASMPLSLLCMFDLILFDLTDNGEAAFELMRRFDKFGRCPDMVLFSPGKGRLVSRIKAIAKAKRIRVVATIEDPRNTVELRSRLEIAFRATPERRQRLGKPAPRVTHEELYGGLRRGEFHVLFQPQISLKNGCWTGVEALARWQHPVHGDLTPAFFLHLIQEPGPGVEFAEHIIRRAINAWSELDSLGCFNGTLSVNVPPAVVRADSHFWGLIKSLTEYKRSDTKFGFNGALSSHAATSRAGLHDAFGSTLRMLAGGGFNQSQVILEVSADAIRRELPAIQSGIFASKVSGVRLSLDNFATVDGRIRQFAKLGIAELKIDASCSGREWPASGSRHFLMEAIDIGKSESVRTVATNVESDGMLRFLRTTGCDLAQGHLISPALLPFRLAEWYRTWPARWRSLELTNDDVPGYRTAWSPVARGRVTRRRTESGLPVLAGEALANCATQGVRPDDAIGATGAENGELLPETQGYPAKPAILVVEDNHLNRELFSEYLTGYGFSVDTACDGSSGVEKALNGKYSVVIMDIQIPGIDGMAAIRSIRGHRPRFSLPILAISALGALYDTDDCLEAGADAYIHKPIRLPELLSAVSSLTTGMP